MGKKLVIYDTEVTDEGLRDLGITLPKMWG